MAVTMRRCSGEAHSEVVCASRVPAGTSSAAWRTRPDAVAANRARTLMTSPALGAPPLPSVGPVVVDGGREEPGMDPPRTFEQPALRPGERVIRPVGELTAATAPAFRTSITCALLEGAHRIVLDLSSTSGIDDLGRDALVRCARAVRARDATLVLAAAPDHVRDLLRCS